MPAGIRVADRVVAVSKSTAGAVIQEFRLSSDKIDVILLGVSSDSNTESFGVLDQFDISNSYILFVGTLEPRKNLRRLLISYSRLSDTLKSDVKLVIVGGKGWGGVDVTDMVSELDLEDYVQVLGYVDDSLLPTLYAHALFLAMPSLYEGFGLPLVEAMIQGTPVLTSNNSSMPEVAGDAGLMIDPLDVCSINNGLEELIMNHELRNQLSENARSNVVRFSWDVAAEQLVAVFEKAIDGKDSRN
jgi:glycosyltransferase involved in cell wall biosynthesis